MSNSFSSDSLLKGQGIYSVVKGDVAGHAFHGNQYRSGAVNELNKQAAFHEGKARFRNPSFTDTRGHTDTYYGKSSHEATAEVLRDVAKKITEDPKPLSEHLEDLKAKRDDLSQRALSDMQTDIYSPRLHARIDAIDRATKIMVPYALKEAQEQGPNAGGAGSPPPPNNFSGNAYPPVDHDKMAKEHTDTATEAVKIAIERGSMGDTYGRDLANKAANAHTEAAIAHGVAKGDATKSQSAIAASNKANLASSDLMTYLS